MKTKSLFFFTAIVLLMACSGTTSNEKVEIDPRDTIQVPEGITGEDSIAYIENIIFKSPITAEQLLSLHEVHELEKVFTYYPCGEDDTPSSDDEYHQITYRDRCAMHLANRFMRMYYLVYQNGTAMDKLQLAMAVNAVLDTFRAEVAEVSRDSALFEIDRVTSKFSSLTQYELNMHSYIDAAMESYQNIEAYRRLISDVPENLKELVEKEFVAWHNLNEVRYVFWRDVSYRQEWYSMKPMEIEYYYSVLSQNRRAELAIERDIILHAKPYRQLGKTVTTRQWENWITKRSVPEDADLLVEMDAVDDYMPSEATITGCANDMRDTFKKWLAIRQAIAAALPEAQGKSYDNLTADMHARIIESLPSIVPIPDFLW